MARRLACGDPKGPRSGPLVVSRPYSRRPPRFAYELSVLAQWGAQRGGGGEAVRHEECGTPLEARWYCPTCGRPHRRGRRSGRRPLHLTSDPLAAVVPDAMCGGPSRQEHAEQVADGLHSGNARQRLYWHGRIGYVLTARAAIVGGGATQWPRPARHPCPTPHRYRGPTWASAVPA
jgi:hypothetical protein